ncbi:EamA family transporter [Pararhizobium haloflavum]|uniref:EamA family transporter n=1 Tax=Pararhizobium haloflavum TaxID=2037914 RepID=UPI000C1772AE|nr:EamA family transporter [Pararhizobium haloflavum]
MPTSVLIVVLLAAVLHATWNALLKFEVDKTAGALAVSIGSAPLAIAALLHAGWPPAAAWPFVLSSAVLHTGYFCFLMNAYRVGDLSQVYPIARGVAPLITAMLASLLLGETLTFVETLAVILIASGLASLVLTARSDGRLDLLSCGLALMTGLFISGYSLNDGAGARIAGDSLSFYGASSLINCIMMAIALTVVRRDVVPKALTRCARSLMIGGPLSFVAYALITWAFTQAPIALVSALRETSVIFALAIGAVFLKERINLVKIVSTFVTLSGAVLLRMQR